MDVYVEGKRIRVDPTKSKGKGGEADIFDIGGSKVLKLFKQPNHPDYEGSLPEQEAACERIKEHQEKLRVFPRNLPIQVVSPEELATDSSGKKILGYVMRFIDQAEVLFRYSELRFRQTGIKNDVITDVFQNIYTAVKGIHKTRVVMGDFNDLNVLVTQDKNIFFIDADSFQFDKFLCRMFTARFVDPLLCDPAATNLLLVKPHTSNSDWYAFMVMLMQCLLFVDPYGGVYKPKNITKRIPHGVRPLQRITIFHPEVVYPKPATHYKILPDDLLQYFHRVLEKDERGEFPEKLLEGLRWTVCSVCSTEHARNTCPNCLQVAPTTVKEVTVIRGAVTATQIFHTRGVIIFASYQNGELRWLYHENNEIKRENDSVVIPGSPDPQMRFRIYGSSVLMGKNGQLVTLTPGKPIERFTVDSFGMLPVFDVNENSRFWTQNGELLRDGQLGPEHIGDVLAGQTLFWVGPKFGFGFYRAGNVSVAFVFDAKRKGINDSIKLPPIRGQLIDSTCVFADTRCWFFTAIQESGKIINRCAVIKQDGSIEAIAAGEVGDGSWLSTLRGKCAAGNFLLAATDEGIIRVEPNNGKITVVKTFPDTEPFVDSNCHIFPGKQGLYAVTAKEIRLLKIK